MNWNCIYQSKGITTIVLSIPMPPLCEEGLLWRACMNKLKIGPRMALAFGAVLLITAMIALIGLTRLGALKDTTQSIAISEMERRSLAQSWTAYINLNWVRTTALLKTNDAAFAEALTRKRGANGSC
jgi:hypothetical protein